MASVPASSGNNTTRPCGPSPDLKWQHFYQTIWWPQSLPLLANITAARPCGLSPHLFRPKLTPGQVASVLTLSAKVSTRPCGLNPHLYWPKLTQDHVAPVLTCPYHSSHIIILSGSSSLYKCEYIQRAIKIIMAMCEAYPSSSLCLVAPAI